MGLPASGVPMKASMINVESAEISTSNGKLAGTGGATAPSTGSFIKRFDDATPSPVDQIKPYAYSDFYGKSFTPPTISCGTSTAAIGQGSGTGYFEAQLDFSTTTGAIVVYFYVSSIPDGVSFLYNGVTYNTLTSNAEGRITAASGTNNIVGETGSEAALIAGSPYTLTKSVWNGTSFGATGNTESGLIAAATNINLGASGLTYTLVIPKTAASPSDGVLKIFGNPVSNTLWRVNAPCPITLPSFTTNSVNSTAQGACCATQNQTYYFARNASIGTTSTFTIDANTLPQANNFVYSNSTGATALTNGYYKISATQAIQVVNGVVSAISTCTTCVTPYTSSGTNVTAVSGCQDTIDQTFYHDGSGIWPVYGDRCFSDAAATTPLSQGFYKTGEFTSTSLGGIYITNHSVTGEPGYMFSTFSCLQSYSSSVNSTSSNVCSATINQTYYHNGGIAASIAVGDTVYTSNTGITKLFTGYYRISSSQYIIVNSSGAVSSINNCVAVTGFNVGNPDTSNTPPCSQGSPGANTYYHDGSGTYPVTGDIIYTNNSATTPLTGGTGTNWPYFAAGVGPGTSPVGWFRITGTTGTVQQQGSCP